MIRIFSAHENGRMMPSAHLYTSEYNVKALTFWVFNRCLRFEYWAKEFYSPSCDAYITFSYYSRRNTINWV
jgi:hypothetical protein